MAEWMDTFIAVFNGHVADADAKAREIMRREHPKMLARVETIESAGGGIMAIFDHKPEAATLLYAGIVSAYANGRIVPELAALRAVAEAARRYRTEEDAWLKAMLRREGVPKGALVEAYDRLDEALAALDKLRAGREGGMPSRIQRRRTPGWRMPQGCIYVGRPTIWGNPFRVGHEIPFLPGRKVQNSRHAASLYAGSAPQNERLIELAKRDLRDHDLACWCGLCDLHQAGKPMGVRCPHCDSCHADVLLELANA